MVSQDILEFMESQNRPHSLNDILQNVGKEHGKPAVQKAVTKLVQQNKLFEKAYGNQRVYCIVQQNVDLSNLEGNLKELDRKINEISAKLKSKDEELQVKISELKSLKTKMTADEATRSLNSLKNEIELLKEKIGNFSETEAEPITPEYASKITTSYEKFLKLFKQRKRLCKEMTDAILEGYPKTKKQLLEEIGIETDEDAGFVFEELSLKK